MDWIKELIETVSNRVKVPVYSSILISLLLFNWKVVFYLTFAKATIIEKFAYFDIHTGPDSLGWPILIGTLLTISSPWIKYAITIVTRRPYEYWKISQNSSQNTISLHKQRLETQSLQEINRYAEELEENLIKRKKRDQRINEEISDPKEKIKLNKEIEEVRKNVSKKINNSPKKQTTNASLPKLDGTKVFKMKDKNFVEISKFVTSFNTVLDNGTYLPPTTFIIDGYYDNANDKVEIGIDGTTAEFGKHISGGSIIYIKRNAFVNLINGDITFQHALKQNKFESYGDLAAFAYLPEFFEKVNKNNKLIQV